MRYILLQNFAHNNGNRKGTIYPPLTSKTDPNVDPPTQIFISDSTNQEVYGSRFTCFFNEPIVIKPNSKLVVLHAEINTVFEQLTVGDLVFINLSNMPVSMNGGNPLKGSNNNIVGCCRVGNNNADILYNDTAVDLNNQEDITLTSINVEILDTDLQLKKNLSGLTGGDPGAQPPVPADTFSIPRQSILIGIYECKCNKKKM